jgi:hypothetical protein
MGLMWWRWRAQGERHGNTRHGTRVILTTPLQQLHHDEDNSQFCLMARGIKV